MKITIKTIPHRLQDYETVGNWKWDKKGNLNIYISNMNNWKYEFLVAYHELAEVVLCKDRKISQKSVDKFDLMFEKEREEGKHTQEAEPGFDKRAPYRKEHAFATKLERLMAKELGVDWKDYDNTIEGL